MKKVAEYFINGLTILVFCILALVIIAKVKMLVTGKDYFDIFGYSIFTVATGSMEPAISQNDIVVVHSKEKYSVNDIITFKKDKSYITHRIIMINDSNLITKGDANNANDVAINKKDILGKVIKIIPNGGIWQKTLTSPKVIITVFITLLLFDFAFSYKGFNKKEDSGQIDVNKLSKEELKKIYEKVNSAESEKEIKELEYTIGLDLESIQKEIKSRLDKGE